VHVARPQPHPLLAHRGPARPPDWLRAVGRGAHPVAGAAGSPSASGPGSPLTALAGHPDVCQPKRPFT
jgi:hypothetical protein